MLLAVLTYLMFSSALEVQAEECTNCIRGENNTCYTVMYMFNLQANFREKIVIKKMAVLYTDNVLYYNYEPEISDPEYYKIAYVNLEDPNVNGTVHDPNALHNFGTFDIDQDKSLVYLGGIDGIFTYGNTKKIAWYSSLGDKVLTVFFKKNLYMVKSNDSRIIVKKGDAFNSVLEYMPIKNFIVTKNNVIVFLGNYGLFLNKMSETFWLSKNAFFRGLTLDLDGLVYTWWIDDIYRVDIRYPLSESRLVKVTSIRNLVAMTFDTQNNILFTVGRGLYKMALANSTMC